MFLSYKTNKDADPPAHQSDQRLCCSPLIILILILIIMPLFQADYIFSIIY